MIIIIIHATFFLCFVCMYVFGFFCLFALTDLIIDLWALE
jgi:hypothetical protein